MRRRAIETIVALAAVGALALVLYNATLVDRRPPTVSRISLSSAAAGDDHLAQTLTAIDVEFSEPVDRTSAERRFRIEPYVSGTFSWDRDSVLIFTPGRKLPSATAFAVSVEPGFADRAGNVASAGAGPFAFQTVGPPVVASSEPAAGAAGIAANTPVRLTFDRLMDTGSVDEALRVEPFAVYHSSWSGPSVTLTFETPLAFGTTYTVTVGSGAADTDGSHLAQPVAVAFTIVQAGLGVDALLPADGVAGIGIGTPIAIFFDTAIDPTSVAGAVRITPSVGGDLRVANPASDVPSPTPGSTSPAPSPTAPGSAGAGTILVFTPSSPLAQHTTYTVELAPVVRRLDDPSQVAAGRTWSFTTGGPSTSAQNQIAFLSARSGVRNLWLMNPDGSNPRQITTELGPVGEYDIASDGRTVVYETAGVVRRMRVDGAESTVLTDPDHLDYAPLLSPDGTSVLVGRRDQAGADLGWWLLPLPGAPSGSQARLVAQLGAPPVGATDLPGNGLVAGPGLSAWSRRAAFDPTGRWLLFVDATGVPALLDLTPTEPAANPLPLGLSGAIGAPTWDPTHAAFLVVAVGPGGSGVQRVVPGTGPAFVIPAAGPVSTAAHGGLVTLVAPDGAHAGYTALPTRDPQPVTTAADLLDRQPGFSPDGTSLLFIRVARADPTRSAGIWTSGLDGRDLRQLTTDGTDARWLP